MGDCIYPARRARVHVMVLGGVRRVSLMVCHTGIYQLRPSTQDGHGRGTQVSGEHSRYVGDVGHYLDDYIP